MKRASATAELSPELPRVFNAEEMGLSLKEVAVDILDADGNQIVSRWFHSSQDVDLFIWMDEQQNMLKHQVSFLGQVVEWNVLEGVKTGLIVETVIQGSEEPGEVIRFDSTPLSPTVQQAISVLRNVVVLDDDDRATIIGNLRTSIRLPQTQDYLQRYRCVLGSRESSRQSFWRRLGRWFSGSAR